VPTAVRLLTQAHDRHPDEFRGHETVFADIATYLDATDLRRAISHWEQQVDYAGSLDDTDTTRQRRRFSFNKTYLGMWNATGDLDPESGHVIATALHSHTDPTNLDRNDRRSMPQRNADALTDICRFWLDHNTDTAISGGERPHITVTVPYATLTGDERRLGEIDGSPVDPETIRRLACDAGVVRIVIDGESQPLDIGRRTRTVPPALRRALELRDGGCTWAGCDAPASWCDAHHIIHWIHGGVTALINLVLLCRKHHTATHNGKHPPDP
ncbi:MAG: HNH endonuclease, partial [Actinomycetia bacterium]|nr:HNH endonuclease [Actinomycetes bacterium]